MNQKRTTATRWRFFFVRSFKLFRGLVFGAENEIDHVNYL